MKQAVVVLARSAACAVAFSMLALAWAQGDSPQDKTYERAFRDSPASIKKILQQMQASMAGHLPVLDGFVEAGDRPLDRYQRPYFQATVQVSANAAGGSVVHVSAKVTAWYADPSGSHSGYKILPSNGRIETDILDQLSERLEAPTPTPANAGGTVEHPSSASDAGHAVVSLPEPRSSAPGTFSSSLSPGLAAGEFSTSPTSAREPADPTQVRLQVELRQLEDVLKNQAHPKNLAAVKKAGTAVVATPSLSAKPLFLASEHDEFEVLNFNQDWVHVRISGLSRGWIWRNDLEMPGDIPDTQATSAPAAATDLFRVERVEIAPFPGDWEPLRGKTVKIISVQKTSAAATDSGPQMKLAFAKSLFEQNYAELAQKFPGVAGIVLIFDSADGGMIAAPVSTLEKWKAGTLSDVALWHACFFDPPETFAASGPS